MRINMRTQYIKDNKIYNLPIEIKTKDGITYTNDENLLKKNMVLKKYVYVEPKKVFRNTY